MSWFGDSFDPTTFAIHTTEGMIPVGGTVALVAHMSHSVSGSVTAQLSYNGQVVSNLSQSMTGSGEIMGTTLGPFRLAGVYTVTYLDVGGNALATGTITCGP